MSAADRNDEARQFDPRREQQNRLVDSAQVLGARLAETFNTRMEAWLGPDLVLKPLGAEIAYGPRPGAAGRVTLGLRPASAPPRLTVASGFFFRYYESMLSGPSLRASKPRALGPTELILGAELGARWIGCLPGVQTTPKAADVWVLAEEDAPALPVSVWPMLRLDLGLAEGDEAGLEILMPLSLLEGGAAVKAAATKSANPASSARRLGQTPIRLQAMLGSVRLHLKELYELRPGDCIMLENGPADGAVVAMGREPVFRVKPGRNGRYLAVQVVGPMNPKTGG